MTQLLEPPTNTATEEPEWLRLKRFCEEFDGGFFKDPTHNGSITWNYLMWQDMLETTRQKVRSNWHSEMEDNLRWILDESEHAIKYKATLTQALDDQTRNVPSHYRSLADNVHAEREYPKYTDIIINDAELFNHFDFNGCIIHGMLRLGQPSQKLYIRERFELKRILFATTDCDFSIETPALSIDNCCFLTTAFFRECSFGDTKLCNVTFQGEVFFGRSIFNSLCLGISNMNATQFKKSVSFNGATFKYNVDCKRGVFTGDANFRNAVFEGDADFSGLTFNTCSFMKAQFEERANFRNTTFERHTVFSQAEFQATVLFCKARFLCKELDSKKKTKRLSPAFIGTQFNGLSNFRDAQFAAPPHFEGAKAEAILLPRDGFFNHDKKDRTLAAQALAALIRLTEATHNLPMRQRFHALLIAAEKDMIAKDSALQEERGHLFFYNLFERFKVGRDAVFPLQILLIAAITAWMLYFGLYAFTGNNFSKQALNALKLVLIDVFPFITVHKTELEALITPFGMDEWSSFLVTVTRYLLSLTSLPCLFLTGLALRNRFRIKS
jgi:uncharacterized protein YjbI with pentapeptide repeats